MKQKVFSILALLLVAATGAWAQKRGGINDDASVAKARIMAKAPRRASAIPTNATILYQQNFDGTNDINELGWTFVDNDGDGRNWTMSINGKYDYDIHDFPSETCTSVPNSLYSQSFTDDGYSLFDADNWAITPAIEIYESSILSFQLAYGNPTYPDQVGVYVGETANVNEMTEVLAPTSFDRTDKRQFNEVTVDLSAFAGKTCYIAFRHKDYDNYLVFIDDVTVYTISHDLTLADGSEDHGTVAFTVGGNAATRAKKDDVVTVSVTPNEGYSAKDVTVRAYTSWEAAGARRRSAPGLVSDITVTKNEENGTWQFTMPEPNVWVVVTYSKNLQDAWIEAIAEQTYTGEAIEPAVTVKDGETTLVLNTDYTVTYSNNTNAGTATVTITAVAGSDYSGTASKTFNIAKADITMTTAPAAVSGLVYSGEAQTLITAGVASFGTVVYSLDGTNFS
ncbi:MAG: choice-of-anchor J domain-containing protein, partial [Prevotella sp.]|nr:choice-of-anchor J domain-containing protein [Prevotella sp.]